MTSLRHLSLGLLLLAVGNTSAQAEATKYTLRYQFQPQETLRWQVTHRAKTTTSVSGSTQTAETVTTSEKIWRVAEVQPDGSATFVHSVEHVDMRHKLTGRPEVRYNSDTNAQPPKGFENVAETVNEPLATVTMDAQGTIIKRQRHQTASTNQNEGPMTIPLPKRAVAVGESWSTPQELQVPLPSGGIRKIKTLQRFTLKSVKTGVARIKVATKILTPINDPAIESQVMQRQSEGIVRFDLDTGRILSQEMTVDKHVVGFRGAASSLHYATNFTEELLPSTTSTARHDEKTAR